jgi:hypothetical protein
MMREPDPYLTPPRVGLIVITVLVFGVIFARIVTMREHAEVRAELRPGSSETITSRPITGEPIVSEPITQGIGGIKGLRGTLP